VDLLGRVRDQDLLSGDVLVMLSGGRDSVCLLDLATRLPGVSGVRAVHVDHGTGAHAREQEARCRALCQELNVALTVERLGPAPAGNRHDGWRRRRLAAAARHLGGGGARVALGHTASDQAETILYRLAASPGRRALLGMEALQALPTEHGPVVVLRPLLGCTRDETAAHCRTRGLSWGEDPGNDDRAFARSRVRHELLGALRAVHPAAEANVLETAAVLRDEAVVLEVVVGAARAACAGAAGEVLLEPLAAQPAAVRRLVLQRLADEAVAAARPSGARAPALRRREAELMALARTGRATALDLGGGLRAVAERGALRFEAEPA